MTEPAGENPIAVAVADGYRFEGPALELRGLMLDAQELSDVGVRIPLAMLNRHGLVAGATGTDVVESGAFKDFMRTAAREIARGMFKSGRR